MMNDPKTRFAAFLASKSKTASRDTLLKKNDTTGMVLVGILDAVKCLPGKRSPGKLFVTLLANRCKVYDDSMFEITDDGVKVLADEYNPEERHLKNMENVILGGFEFEDGITDHVGGLVKCHGFQRNKAGYLVAKQVNVLTHTSEEKVNTVLGLAVQIPKMDFETSKDRYVGTVLQFRSMDESHPDWSTGTVGNACSITTANAKYRTDGDELLFKGSCDAMSYGDDTANYLIELYWPAVVCKKFGVTSVDAWEALAPTMLGSMRGFIKVNIDVVKSSGLSINDTKQEAYAAGYSVYSNHVEVDLPHVLKASGTTMTTDEVFEFFDEEYMLEYENSADNPLNSSASLVKNLCEYSGNLKKILEAENAQFYGVKGGETTNVFVVLSAPLSKKRKK